MRAWLLAIAMVSACGINETPQPDPVPTLPSCTPNLDGVITADELPIALGASLDYYQSPPATTRMVDLAAKPGTDNNWDLSDEQADDLVIALGPIALHDQWYAAEFPSSQFSVADGDLDGVYHQDEQALWLDGTASRDEMPAAGKTLIRYTDPVAVLRFPITDGDAFSTVAPLPDAVVDGLPFIGSDTIDVDVTGTGRLEVPYVDFEPALRVRTHVTRAPTAGVPSVSTRSTAFLFECFGEIAHADSEVDEPDPDFTTAASLRRFALGETP